MPARFSPRRLLLAHRDALALVPESRLRFLENLSLALLHFFGIAALAYYFRLVPAAATALIAAAIAIQFVTSAALLAPLIFAYSVLAARVFLVRVMHGAVGGYFDYELPEWGLIFLHVGAATVASAAYTTLIGASLVLRSRRQVALLAASSLTAVTLVWSMGVYLGSRTFGTTASDPYTYVQMGIDLARNGTAVHNFPLFPEFATAKIVWYPLIHVGYRLPMDQQGDAISVFPIGGSFVYAAVYRILGEAAIYYVNPLLTLAASIAAGLLAWELTRDDDCAIRLFTSSCTFAIVATANQQVVWAGVTMVDTQAELLSVLCLYFALRMRHDKSVWPPILSGASLGAAYWVRHTQIVLAVSLVILFWASSGSLRGRLRALFLSSAAASALAFGDLWYHQTYLGGWLHPESEELALFSMGAIASSAWSLFLQAFSANEFGWLAPFLIFGVVQFVRRRRVESAALFAWLIAILALHLPYAAVRLRDLLPEFPAVAFLTAFGICALAANLLSSRRFRWAAGAALFGCLELSILRSWNTLPKVVQPAQPAFGYMTTGQRASFDRLAAITPVGSLIGSTLNDGAIELYSGRNSFRPDGWNRAERREFLKVVRMDRLQVYLLEDGHSMDVVLNDLRDDMSVTRVATLDVPVFGEGQIADPGALWEIAEK